MLRIAFIKNPLIKISMAYAYIKPEVKKKNPVPITTTNNESFLSD